MRTFYRWKTPESRNRSMFRNNVPLALTHTIGINCERRSFEKCSSIDSKAFGAPMLLSDRLLSPSSEDSMVEMVGVGVAPGAGPQCVDQGSTKGGKSSDRSLAELEAGPAECGWKPRDSHGNRHAA
jgi:hypothetical protein